MAGSGFAQLRDSVFQAEFAPCLPQREPQARLTPGNEFQLCSSGKSEHKAGNEFLLGLGSQGSSRHRAQG